MPSETTIAPLTYDELIRRATEDWGAVTNMAYTASLSHAEANRIAAKAITAAIEDWCHETGERYEAVPWPMQVTALQQIVDAGWDEWEREQQLDLFEDIDIWRGAAAHEARRELW
jgi:hypothetical protein